MMSTKDLNAVMAIANPFCIYKQDSSLLMARTERNSGSMAAPTTQETRNHWLYRRMALERGFNTLPNIPFEQVRVALQRRCNLVTTGSFDSHIHLSSGLGS